MDELIKALRECGKASGNRCGDCAYYDREPWCEAALVNDAADAIEAAEKRIAELEDDLRNSTISNVERFKIYGYTVRDLILFAELCKRNDVQEADMKQAAWNLELAVRAVMNERQEIIEKEMNKIAMRCTPDLEKAYAEMMGKENDNATD